MYHDTSKKNIAMNIENRAAFHFIMQDDIYLLNNDKILYSNNTTTALITEPATADFNYFGGNRKKFFICAHYPDNEFMDDKHLIALENALKRLSFNMDDVAIFNISKYPDATFDQLKLFFNPVKMLLLGKKSLPLNVERINFNEVNQFMGCNTLYSFSFGEMMDSTENKKVFWEKLKQL